MFHLFVVVFINLNVIYGQIEFQDLEQFNVIMHSIHSSDAQISRGFLSHNPPST